MKLRSCAIKELTGVPTPTIWRFLCFNQPRHDTNPQSGQPPKISAWDLRSLVRAITSGPDGRRASYTVIAKELDIITSDSTLHHYL